MSSFANGSVFAIILCGMACSRPSTPAGSAIVALDSLQEEFLSVHRQRDAQAYAALHTDGAVFEWFGIPPIRGRDAIAQAMRDNWAERSALALEMTPEDRRVYEYHALEFGSYRESWLTPTELPTSEYGRYAMLYVRSDGGPWRIQRMLGFTDSLVPPETVQ